MTTPSYFSQSARMTYGLAAKTFPNQSWSWADTFASRSSVDGFVEIQLQVVFQEPTEPLRRPPPKPMPPTPQPPPQPKAPAQDAIRRRFTVSLPAPSYGELPAWFKRYVCLRPTNVDTLISALERSHSPSGMQFLPRWRQPISPPRATAGGGGASFLALAGSSSCRSASVAPPQARSPRKASRRFEYYSVRR